MGTPSDDRLRKAVERAAHEFRLAADDLRAFAGTLPSRDRTRQVWAEQMAARFDAQAAALSAEIVNPDRRIVRSILKVGANLVLSLGIGIAGNVATDSLFPPPDFSAIEARLDAVNASLVELRGTSAPAGLDVLTTEDDQPLTDEDGNWLWTEDGSVDQQEADEFFAETERNVRNDDDLISRLTEDQRRQVAEEWMADEDHAVEYAEAGIDHDDKND